MGLPALMRQRLLQSKAVKAGNAKDVDIAAQILAQYTDDDGRSWTEEEEKKLIRKVDWMIVPIVSVLR